MSSHARPDWLSPLDMSNLRVEDHGLPMQVAALVVLDTEPMADAAGRLRLDRLCQHLEQRLNRVPRLRQVLDMPRPGRACWVDDPAFDIRHHVRLRAVPAPGDEAALLRVCSSLFESRLDRSRPLWDLWLLPGLAGGRTGMLIRLHHVVADGIAALAMLSVLFDTATAGGGRASPRLVPHRPPPLGSRAARLARQAADLAREGRAPRTSWNVPAGRHRRLLLLRTSLEQVRAVAHAHGGTVNDMVLAAVTGGARALLAARGELRPGLELKASVPASVRAPQDPSTTGNRAGVMLIPLPAAQADPDERLGRIIGATARRKRQPPYQPQARLAGRWTVRVMSRQRLVNVLTSDLAGPAEPWSFAGTRVLDIFQIGVIQGNLTIAVGVLSYAGHLNVAVLGDPDAVPDLDVFAAGMSGALAELGMSPSGEARQHGP